MNTQLAITNEEKRELHKQRAIHYLNDAANSLVNRLYCGIKDEAGPQQITYIVTSLKRLNRPFKLNLNNEPILINKPTLQ